MPTEPVVLFEKNLGKAKRRSNAPTSICVLAYVYRPPLYKDRMNRYRTTACAYASI
jgi:hypothetical protein